MSASFLAVTCATGAHAQTTLAAAATPGAVVVDEDVEAVVVTGSLIRGVEAVGKPVTSLGVEDFKKIGAVTIGDILLAEPAITMIAGSNVINGGGYVARNQNINIRNLSQKGTRTLMMIDGMRFPNQGNGGCQTDPSIIPQLAVQRVDILADGASATYGSDAVAGVVNVILKRGFEGAITQAQFGGSIEIGGARKMISQLVGKSWEGGFRGLSGNVTMSYEYYDQAHIKGTIRDYFTQDFRPWGADDRRNIINSRPGIVSVGAPTAIAGVPAGFVATLGDICANCYSVPINQNGTALTWNQLLANKGTQNKINVFEDAWAAPRQQRHAATLTFDQGLTSKISLYADAWYSRRTSQMIATSASSTSSQTVPLPATGYPYYPIGAPANLQVSYDLAREIPNRVRTKSIAARYAFGLNFELPMDWKAKIYRSHNFINEIDKTSGTVNRNMVRAAVGNTIPATVAVGSNPGIPAFTKPANIPYLNLFCDPYAFTCNSPETLAYISGFRDNDMKQHLTEYGFLADGPLFALPGGDLKAAVGGTYVLTDYWNYQVASNANNTQVISTTLFEGKKKVWSGFAQLNMPLVGGDFTLPLMERLIVETSVRYDHYNRYGSTTNPKLGIDWGVGLGLSLNGSLGTSFRAPSFQEDQDGGPAAVNTLATAASNTIGTCANIGDAVRPGTIAAQLGIQCTAANQFLGGLSLSNNAQSAAAIRPGGVNLRPEKGTTLSAGFKFQPRYGEGPFGFLDGLDISASYWFIKIEDKLQGFFGLAGLRNGQLNDPNYTKPILTRANDPLFDQHVLALLNNPQSSLPVSIAPNISYIVDGAITNIGWQSLSGVDLKANYRWSMFDLGRFNAGINGTLAMTNKSRTGKAQPVISYYDENHDGRFRYRANLGWGGLDKRGGDWSINAFMNFIPHYEPLTNPLPPLCFQTGNTPCNVPGIPALASYTTQSQLTKRVPSVYTFDLSIGYDTGQSFKRDALNNIRVQLTVNNIFNKEPPYQYAISSPGAGAPHAFFTSTAGTELGIQGTIASINIQKTW